MDKIKDFIRGLSWKQIILTVIVLFCLIIWGGLTFFSTVAKNGLPDQNAAKRWSEENDTAQVSCFFTESTEIDKNKIMSFEHELDTLLKEASITAPNENARLWVDAIAHPGKLRYLRGKHHYKMHPQWGLGGIFSFFIRCGC